MLKKKRKKEVVYVTEEAKEKMDRKKKTPNKFDPLCLAVIQALPQADPRSLTSVQEILPHAAVQLQPEAPQAKVSLDVRLHLRPGPCFLHQLLLFFNPFQPFACQCHQSIQLERPFRRSAH